MKKMVCGIIIGLMIGTVGTAIAATNETVQAVFAEFNLVINGEVKTLETVPLVYNGTSYLPVRELSNLVGYNVTYLADSRTIQLSETEGPEPALEGMEVKDLAQPLTLNEILHKIEMLENDLRMNDAMLSPSAIKGMSPERLEAHRGPLLEQKAKIEAELAELKQKKAELEAQTQ